MGILLRYPGYCETDAKPIDLSGEKTIIIIECLSRYMYVLFGVYLRQSTISDRNIFFPGGAEDYQVGHCLGHLLQGSELGQKLL